MEQLDNARSFGSTFEKQEWRDIFRIPYMRHPEKVRLGDRAQDSEGGAGEVEEATKARGFGSTSRTSVPSWIRDEQAVDKGRGSSIARADDPGHEQLHEHPEHFAQVLHAQEEWYQFEIYAR